MGEKKRRAESTGAKVKRRRVDIIDPGWQGIFVTTERGRESKGMREIMDWLREAVEELWPAESSQPEKPDNNEQTSIEDEIKQEIEGLPGRESLLKAYDSLGCECVIFIRTKTPISPTKLVEYICQQALDGCRNVRYAHRLSPVEVMGPLGDDFETAMKKFKPYISKEFSSSFKFAIRPTIRMADVDRLDVIKRLASAVGEGHKVDLKDYEKLLLVDCFKSVIGMAIVGPRYDNDYARFNVRQIQERRALSTK